MVQSVFKKDSPKLSIVVPVYNGSKYIVATMESLISLGQQLDIEVIFQNSRSTDGTTEIIDRYCYRRERWLHFNEKDSGQSEAINRGIARAGGQWVTWLCADDILLTNLSQAIAEADQNGADVVYGDVIFSQDHNAIPAVGTETHHPGALAKRRLIIQQPGTCILRNVWQEIGGVNPSLNWVMDYDLFLRLEAKRKSFYRSRQFVAIARIHRQAKTSSGSIRRMLEIWSILFKNHLRQPFFFRFGPYLVFLLEYFIKNREAKRIQSVLMSRFLLPRMHQFFWILTIPKEKSDIQKRFQVICQELSDRLPHLLRN